MIKRVWTNDIVEFLYSFKLLGRLENSAKSLGRSPRDSFNDVAYIVVLPTRSFILLVASDLLIVALITYCSQLS